MAYTEKIAFDFSSFSNENLNEIIKQCEKEKEKRRRLEYEKSFQDFLLTLEKLVINYPYDIAFEDGVLSFDWADLHNKILSYHS